MRRLLETQAAWPASSSTLPGRYRASLDHRTGLRRLWPRGSHRQRRCCFAARGRIGGAQAGRTGARQRALPGYLGAPASHAADPAHDAALDRAGTEAPRLIILRIARAGRPCRIAIAVIGSGRWRSAGRLATVRAANSPFPSRPPRRARGKPALGRRQEMLGPSSRIAQWEHASMFRRTFLICATFGAMSAPALPKAPIGRLGLAIQ
jgi:hypothetical protein